MEKKKIIIFGGAFNPPLNSHFSFAEQMLNEFKEVEKVIFVPVNSLYQKKELIENEHRYQMLKLVCDKNDRFEVSKIELEQSRQLFTIETLRIFQKQYLNYEIYFTMGSDNLKELEMWKRSTELVDEFKFLIIERDKDIVENIVKNNKFLNRNKEKFSKVNTEIHSNLSSTFVRSEVKNGRSIRYLAPDEVVDYINKNKLYM